MLNTRTAAAIVALAALTACRSSPHTQPDPIRVPASHTMQPEALTPLLAGFVAPNPPVIILDARPLEQFEAGRLAGAVHADIEPFDQAARTPGSSGDPAWAQRLGDLGISGSERVLVYDDGRMTHARTVWSVLQHHGLTTAAVIAGGYPAIAPAVRSDLITSGPATAPTPVRFTPPSGR